MLFRFIPALFILIGLALLFCHPSPFREPEYLKNRTRLLHERQNQFINLWTNGDFDSNLESDSAYVVISRSGSDSGKVFVRFTHLIPSIELPNEFIRISHIENVNDIDNDGGAEIYFVANRLSSCTATGFLYSYYHHHWRLLHKLDQEGCAGFNSVNYVSVIGEKRFKIHYQTTGSGYDHYYEGVVN